MVARVVIAAPGSNHGKTTLATGLLAAFAARGVRVAPFKVGPDYIDPGYHALAAGRPGRNLDPVLSGESLVAPLFRHGAAGADLAIVEGVLGLFDGRAGQGDTGSTAHVAGLIDAPVIMVVDVRGQGRSVAALLRGFDGFGPARVAGVILNRVGSARHEEILRAACAEVPMPVLGAMPRDADLTVPSRHLGLVPAAERHTTGAMLAKLADVVTRHVDLDRIHRIARGAGPPVALPWAPPAAAPAYRPVVAVAGGAAFTFSYAENVELLAAAGAEVRVFDPLTDERLPPGTAALVVGGGFPEVYAAELSANTPLRSEVRELLSAGAPAAAECAGMLWLGRSLDGAPMCGVLDVTAEMTGRLRLGYRDAIAATASVLAPAGTRVTGHEFHRTVVHRSAESAPAWRWDGSAPDGIVAGNVHASYLHLHWAAYPSVPHRLVDAARRHGAGARAAVRQRH
ncbi:cobyrinate a,c-diamide synthase [Symbioplanes lichenis]|uniref:cobyrinate a,c-diamide synthase n=1 Tax=Symbioplanes lichenis TaxID=1629072 RepID=UPI0027387761|nr:cobyrinate a,c-diamide synthase [Actinoplanes lichenis]